MTDRQTHAYATLICASAAVRDALARGDRDLLPLLNHTHRIALSEWIAAVEDQRRETA